MADQLRSAIVRIHQATGKVVGAGFVVSNKHIFTCAHVVNAALKKQLDSIDKPTETISLDLPLLAPEHLFQAQVVGWVPVQPSSSIVPETGADIALLELNGCSVHEIQPVKLLKIEDLWKRSFRVFGFPEGQPVGVWTEGIIRERQVNGRIQIEVSSSSAYRIESGFSGSPIWDEQLEGVVGMTVAIDSRRPDIRAAFIIPTTQLINACPQLKEYACVAVTQPTQNARSNSKNNHLKVLSSLSIFVTIAVMCVRFLGELQWLELWALDQIMYLQNEPQDEHILVVTIDQEDIKFQQEFRNSQEESNSISLSDQALSELLIKLDQYQPRVIGLDIYKNNEIKIELLKNQIQSPNFFAVCKVPDLESGETAPPTGIPSGQVGFSDVAPIDVDLVLRRQLIALQPPPESACQTDYALSFLVAGHYLAGKGLSVELSPEQFLQIGHTVFEPINSHWGGYQGIDTGGYQIFLNYRTRNDSIEKAFSKVSFQDLLTKEVNEDFIKDKIVLIGTIDPSFRDLWNTPYTHFNTPQTAGVYVQAAMVSQIVNAVLNDRPLVWVWPMWAESLWILSWALLGGISTTKIKRLPNQLLMTGLAMLILVVVSSIVFLQWGGWIPLIPPILAWGCTILIVKIVKNLKII